MKIDSFVKRLGVFVKAQDNVRAVSSTAKAVSKTASNAVKKAPSYAAVKVNGLVVFMPVEKVPKGATVLSKELNSVDDIIKAMSTNCNTVSLK